MYMQVHSSYFQQLGQHVQLPHICPWRGRPYLQRESGGIISHVAVDHVALYRQHSSIPVALPARHSKRCRENRQISAHQLWFKRTGCSNWYAPSTSLQRTVLCTCSVAIAGVEAKAQGAQARVERRRGLDNEAKTSTLGREGLPSPQFPSRPREFIHRHLPAPAHHQKRIQLQLYYCVLISILCFFQLAGILPSRALHQSLALSSTVGLNSDLKTILSKLSRQQHDAKTTTNLDELNRLVQLILKQPDAAGEVWRSGIIPVIIELSHCGRQETEEQARVALSLLGYAPPYAGRGLRILAIDGGGTR